MVGGKPSDDFLADQAGAGIPHPRGPPPGTFHPSMEKPFLRRGQYPKEEGLPRGLAGKLKAPKTAWPQREGGG